MNTRILLLGVFLFIEISEVYGIRFENRTKSMTEELVMKDKRPDSHRYHHWTTDLPRLRQKRGFGSIIKLFGRGIKAAAKPATKVAKRVISSEKADLALNIAEWTHSIGNGLTDGCMSYHDICTGVEEMKNLEKENNKLFAEVKSWETNDNDKLETLKIVHHENSLLQKKIVELVKDFRYIENLTRTVDDQFNNSISRSFSEELNIRFSELEHELNHLRTFIRGNRLNTLMSTGIDIMVNYLVTQIKKSLSKNYKHEWQKYIDHVYYDQSKNLNDEDLDKLRSGKINKTMKKKYNIKYSKFKLALKTLSASFKGFGKAFVHFPGKVKNAFAKPKNTLEKIQFGLNAKIAPFRNRKNFIKTLKEALNKKVSKLKLVIGGFSKVTSVLNMYLTEKRYKELNDEVKDKVEKYKALNKDLKIAIQYAEQNFSLLMESAINNFVELAQKFQSFVNSQHPIILAEIIPPQIIPVNISHQLLQNYSNVNSRNIKHEQRKLLRLLRDPRYNVQTLKNWLKARYIMRTEILEMMSKNLPFQEVYYGLPNVYKYVSDGVKEFGMNFTLADKLCDMAMVDSHSDTYDYFNISYLREECVTNMSTLSVSEVLRGRREMLIRRKIEYFVSNEEFGEVISTIIDNICRNLREDTYMIPPYNSTPTKQELICQIAVLYPRKLVYNFHDLEQVRPRCLTGIMNETVFKQFDEQSYQRRVANISKAFRKEMTLFDQKHATGVKEFDYATASSLSQSSNPVREKQNLDAQKTEKRDDVKLTTVNQKLPVKNNLLSEYITANSFLNSFTTVVPYETTSIQKFQQDFAADSKNITVIMSEDVSSNSRLNNGNRTGHRCNAGYWALLLAIMSLLLSW